MKSNDFIMTIAFILPGLLAYFWLRMFGVNPPTQPSGVEILAISALLWVPTVTLFILGFNAFVYITGSSKYSYIATLDDIKIMSNDLLFLLCFYIVNIFTSFLVALIWSSILYKLMLKVVNCIRVNVRKLSKLDELTSVWDKFFIEIQKNDEEREERGENENEEDFNKNKKGGIPLIVEIYKLGEPDKKIVGSVIGASRPFEPERALILGARTEWEKFFEENKGEQFEIRKTYVDLKSGLVVNELDVPIDQSKT